MATKPHSPFAERRQTAGYTQVELAAALHVARITVGRWERGLQSPQPWQRADLARCLDLTLEGLDDILRRTRELASDMGVTGSSVLGRVMQTSSPGPKTIERDRGAGPNSSVLREDVVRSAIPLLRRALDSIDLPEDRPVRSRHELVDAVAEVSRLRVQAEYGPLATRLPALVSELARVASMNSGSSVAARLLTLALRSADGLAYKYGYLDLSARIIDVMRGWAAVSSDPLVQAMTAYVRTENFFVTGDLGTASRLLVAAADELPAHAADPMATSASYGALHMRAAVVAARRGKADLAQDHLKEANRAARRVPEAVYLGTAFGPASVRIHELAVAVELGDSPAAVERAAVWHPPTNLPAERRSHYYIDLGRAELSLGHYQAAWRSISAARQIAPQHIRQHPQVRSTLAGLLRAHWSGSGQVRELAAWAHVG